MYRALGHVRGLIFLGAVHGAGGHRRRYPGVLGRAEEDGKVNTVCGSAARRGLCSREAWCTGTTRRGADVTEGRRGGEIETEAASLRRRMLAASRFNLRDVREAQVALATIRGGNGVDDLVQDLFDLASVCVKYAPAFDADRSFDVDEHIDKARTLGRRLSHVVSSVRLGTDATAARELRDRAFSYMQELVNEIRFAGRYAFRDDPISVARFSSRHLKKQRRASKKAAASAASSTSAPAGEAAIVGPFEETVELPADEGDGMN